MPYRNLPSSDAASLNALRALVKKQLATPPADWLYDAAQGAELAFNADAEHGSRAAAQSGFLKSLDFNLANSTAAPSRSSIRHNMLA